MPFSIGDCVEVVDCEGKAAITGTVTGFRSWQGKLMVIVTDNNGFEYDDGLDPKYIRHTIVQLSVKEMLSDPILRMHGARVIHASNEYAHVEFPSAHAATSWASPNLSGWVRFRELPENLAAPCILIVPIR